MAEERDWIHEVGPPRLGAGSTGTVIQEPDLRPPGSQAPPAGLLLQKHTSLPPPQVLRSRHSDSRALTDPAKERLPPLRNQALFAEPFQPHSQASPPLNIAPRPAFSSRSNSSEVKIGPVKPLLLSPSANTNILPAPSRFHQDIWSTDLSAPGAVLFSTGPTMEKSAGTTSSEADAGRPTSIESTLWSTPSGLVSSDPATGPARSPEESLASPSGHDTDPSFVHSAKYPSSNPTPHAPTYPSGYHSHHPGSRYGALSPQHQGFSGSPAGGHTNTYTTAGASYPYAGYRPNMSYGPFPSYQSTLGYNRYASPMGSGYSGFPQPEGSYSGPSSVSGGYSSPPPANAYPGSPSTATYSSPTGAYGMHFTTYGMVSGPPMYAPTTYAHAPYGHPYLPQQGQSDEGQGAGTWWFMPAGAGSVGPHSGYGAQPQAPYVQRLGSSQQTIPQQPQSAQLNPTSPHLQQLAMPGFPAVQTSATHTLSPTVSASMFPASSPRQMYAAFGGMNLQPHGAAPPPTVSRHVPPLSLTVPDQSSLTSPAVPTSPSTFSHTRPQSSPKGDQASAGGKIASSAASPTARRPWHPNPPAARSDWVMWVGNVPSDATHDELWTFFNQDTTAREPSAAPGPGRTLLPHAVAAPTTTTQTSHGVSSVFLISRSNCAFVNYEEEAYLTRAVSFFNGHPLRPHEARCPRLVCRVRRKDDDLRAGVGGQRGIGLHARWLQEQERRARGEEPKEDDPESPSALAPADEGHQLSADTAGEVTGLGDTMAAHHSGSASTNSSLLARNFPKRYFILKSLTQFDLNVSVDRSLWATQPHNEPTLNQAYRTSQDVYLIFSANKSGEWFGYARMEGPIVQTQQSVNWESRTLPRSPASAVQRKSELAVLPEQPSESLAAPAGPILSPSEHKFAVSPAPITPGEALKLQVAANTPNADAASPTQPPRVEGLISAPAELGDVHKQLTNPARDAEEAGSPDHPRRHTGAAVAIARVDETFELDENAPLRAARDASEFGPSRQRESHVDDNGVVHKDTALTTDELERARNLSGEQPPRPIRESLAPDAGDDKIEGWGNPFKIKWVRTQKLPFHRTRHLRNPWNNDREVKVSRDGTEVEPSVGQLLIEEWDRTVEPEPAAAVASMSRHVPSSSRPGMSTYGSAPPNSKAAPPGALRTRQS